MAITDYFSPVAFFILLREALEAGIIIAVLLGLVSQIAPPTSKSHLPVPEHVRTSEDSTRSSTELLSNSSRGSKYGTATTPNVALERTESETESSTLLPPGTESLLSPSRSRSRSGSRHGHHHHHHHHLIEMDFDRDAVMRKMKLQIWLGAILGGTVALAIGGVFLYVFYHYTHDLWQDAENLWEGSFCLIASILILLMSLAFLRLPHAQTKWRLKLLSAYQTKSGEDDGLPSPSHHRHGNGHGPGRGRGRRPSHSQRFKHMLKKQRANRATAILFGLPFITVLREGLEGVVFIGGIGLSESGTSLAGGGIGGLIVGGLLAYLLFSTTSPLSLRTFTTLSSLLLFMIGAGLASRAAFSLERQYFINGVGVQAAEAGNGPGSYRVAGNLWHLPYGDPEPGAEGGGPGWQLAQSLVGWNNTGTIWTVSTYISYWLIIILTLVYTKYKEGRTTILGHQSKRGRERELARRHDEADHEDEAFLSPSSSVPAERDL